MKFRTILSSALLILAVVLFSSCEQNDTPDLQTKTYTYAFNTGQINSAYAYSGSHPNDLTAKLMLEEQADGKTKITVTIMNPQSGQTYATHAHDKADAATTPNTTPYNASPNGAVIAQMISNGEASMISDKSFSELTTEYEGFFVIHDPLQAINTADPTTYVVLGNFARE